MARHVILPAVPPGRCLLLLLLSALPFPAAAADASDAFEVTTFSDPGRTVLAELVDLDGDGRRDLLQGVIRGIPPAEERLLRVRLQTADGRLPDAASFELPLPAGASAYDLGDLRDTPGSEMVLLRARDLLVLSLTGAGAPRWSLPLAGGTSIGAGQDERGLERLRMVYSELGPGLRLLAPLLGSALLLAPDGRVVASLALPSRANFYIPRSPGFYFGESDAQLFFDAPRISVGDVDGDGRADLVAANRHEIRVFLQTAAGGFPNEADRTLALGLMEEKDHIRGSGGVACDARDFDGDGRIDLLVSHVAGSFADARSTTSAFLNRDGTWDRTTPVGVFRSTGAVADDSLVDLDGDGRVELVRAEVPMGVLPVVELLVTRAVDVVVRIHRFGDGAFSAEPAARLGLELPVSFDTFRTAGFLPHVHADLNGDGVRDLLLGGSGKRIEVRLGGRQLGFARSDASQAVDTAGKLQVGDLDGDGLDDLLIFSPQEPGRPLRLLRNRGVLPGTAPRLAPGGAPGP